MRSPVSRRVMSVGSAMVLTVGLMSAAVSGVGASTRSERQSAASVTPLAGTCDANGGAYFSSGDGSMGSPYVIDDSVSLANIDDSGGDFLGCSFVMTTNISVAGNPWTPIAPNPAFAGTFDGGGFTISDLVIDDSTSTILGLFGTADGATFRNLVLSAFDISGSGDVGGLVGFSIGNSTFTNIGLLGRVSGEYNVGGLVGNDRDGDLLSVVANVTVDDSNFATGSYGLGGLVGYAEGSRVDGANVAVVMRGYQGVGGVYGYSGPFNGTRAPQIHNADVTGTIDTQGPVQSPPNGEGQAGGLSGYAAALDVLNSTNSATITSTVDGLSVGGLIGQADASNSIVESANLGDISGGYEVGGLIGLMDVTIPGSNTIERSSNSAAVSSVGSAGGIVGTIDDSTVITQSYSTGSVSSSGDGTFGYPTGGLVGFVNLPGDVDISFSYATGAVTSGADAFGTSGGLVGEVDGDLRISSSYALGNASSDDSAGGLVGDSAGNNFAIADSYSIGQVTSVRGAGGLIASFATGTVTDSFWNTTTSGRATSAGGTGLSTAAMTVIDPYRAANWVISEGWQAFDSATAVWGICSSANSGYPFLLWQFTVNPCGTTPPAPTPPTPAGPPTDVSAVPGDASATVSWAPPNVSGSFPVTSYQVSATPGGATCITAEVSCDISGLENGTPYTFIVRALTGAGWGSWSASSQPVTPRSANTPSILISGTRGEVRGRPGVLIRGSSEQLAMGAIVNPWLRFPGQTQFTRGSARIVVDMVGDFTWQRRTGKKVTVYVATPDGLLRSNRVTIAAR